MQSNTSTPGRPGRPGVSGLVPVPIPVSVQRRSVRKRVIKNPYDPSAQTFFSTTEAEASTTFSPQRSKVPTASRSILGVENVQGLISEAAVCRKCRRKALLFSVENIGIASIPSIECRHCENINVKASPKMTEFRPVSSQRRLTDYAVNVLFVLGFLSVGDGGREAQRLLGLLDLPSLTSMETKTFSRIEKEIAPVIIQIAEETFKQNLIDEVHASPDLWPATFDFESWKASLESGNTLPVNQHAFVRAGTDMGWQQRRGAQDSLSGHAFLFGVHTRRPIWRCVRYKGCKICSLHRNKEETPVHECHINHEGSSKSMEPKAVVDMVTELYDRFNCRVEYLVTDDDSTMKANCRWGNEDYKKEYGDYPRVPDKEGKLKKRKDTGILRYPIPQPLFLADPNHRVKTVRNAIRSIQTARVMKTFGCLEVDTLRISKNFAYFVRTLAAIPETEWESSARAVIDHHFDVHEHCGAFCRRKDETDEERKNSGKFYRCREKDAELYSALYEKIGEYLQVGRLREVAHNYDTNCNESMNNMIAWVAPKNKYYSGSMSLQTRIAMAVGVQTMGFESYFRHLLGRLGVELTPGTAYWLTVHNKYREKKRDVQRTIDSKKKRKRVFFERLRAKTEQARKDIANGVGYYKNAHKVADEHEADGQPKKKRRKLNKNGGRCRCGSLTHLRTNSLQCPLNKAYADADPELIEQLRKDVEEQALLDTLTAQQVALATMICREGEKENE